MKEKPLLVVFLIVLMVCGSALVTSVDLGRVNKGANVGGDVAVQSSDPETFASSSQVTFSAPNYNATRARDVTQFQITVNASAGVAGYIFFNGVSNSSYTPVGGAPTSLLINSTVVVPSSSSVSVEWYADDEDGVWTSSGLYSYPVYQMPSSVLAANGNMLYLSNGTSIVLRGVDYTYFADDPYGSWMMPDGSVDWQSWNTAGVADFVNLCQTWKVNVVRAFLTVQFWEDANHTTYLDHLSYFADALKNAGIYVDFCFYRDNATDGEPAFLPWEDSGNGYINSPQDFVNLWTSFSAAFANAPNVIFELWNEPQGPGSDDKASWFSATQNCVDAIRAAGASNPIVVGWGVGVSYDFYAYESDPTAGIYEDMSFMTQYPLSDPAGNLIYTTHIYRSNFFNSADDYAEPYLSTDSAGFNMFQTLNLTGVFSAAQNHVVWVGEIGDRLYGMLDSQSYEDEWFNNTLSLLNQHSIGYAGFAAPPWSDGSGNQFGFVTLGMPNYTLDNSGIILVDSLEGKVNSHPSPSPTPNPASAPSHSETVAPTPNPSSTPSQTPQPSVSPAPSSPSPSSLRQKFSLEASQAMLIIGGTAVLIVTGATAIVMKRRHQ